MTIHNLTVGLKRAEDGTPILSVQAFVEQHGARTWVSVEGYAASVRVLVPPELYVQATALLSAAHREAV